VADDARRGVTVLTAMTPVVTAAVGVVINLATDGKHSWWAWVLVGVVTVVSVVVAVMLARRQGASERSSGGSAGLGRPGRAASVDVRGSQGVQIGDHNTQANTFNSPPSP
jgi:hypothetical protein